MLPEMRGATPSQPTYAAVAAANPAASADRGLDLLLDAAALSEGITAQAHSTNAALAPRYIAPHAGHMLSGLPSAPGIQNVNERAYSRGPIWSREAPLVRGIADGSGGGYGGVSTARALGLGAHPHIEISRTNVQARRIERTDTPSPGPAPRNHEHGRAARVSPFNYRSGGEWREPSVASMDARAAGAAGTMPSLVSNW